MTHNWISFAAIFDDPMLNTWELIFIIFGGTLLFCTIVLSSYWYFQRRKRGSNGRQFIQEDSVCDPILNGNTIQDIIEMTTSGSGSGEYVQTNQCAFISMCAAMVSCMMQQLQGGFYFSFADNFALRCSWSTVIGSTFDRPSNSIDWSDWKGTVRRGVARTLARWIRCSENIF